MPREEQSREEQLAYKYKDKQHYKHVIVVPEEAVNELGWKGGHELELNVKADQLTIKPRKSAGLHEES